jgi:PhzF family phenazine biosynthesis protein
MRLAVYHVDAFTDRAFGGNPAAVCPLDSWLDDERLRKVAAESNLSATAFFVAKSPPSHEKRGKGGAPREYELRWYTPVCEIRLCGHATLAAGHVILNVTNRDTNEVRFETRFSGALTVKREASLYCMDFPAFPARRTTGHQRVIEALGSTDTPSDVLEANDTFVAVFERKDSVAAFRPDFAQLAALHPYSVVITAPGRDVDFVSRYFAPSYGVPEDPVTGSAHCILTPYWAERLGKSALRARQLSERGGELRCEMAGDRVVLKAGAVLTMQATMAI